jgi:hypothetical protein
MAAVDIQGSLAHAEMLSAQNIISAQDYADIQRGMAQIQSEIESGKFEWLLDLEDVHLNIEKRLTELVGDAGKRLHTGRSRNDQVATDIRLYMRSAIDNIVALLRALRSALIDLAEKMQRRFCRVLRTCKSHNRSRSGITFSLTLKCSDVIPSACWIAANASIVCHWAQQHWRAPPSRSTVNVLLKHWALMKSATTPWMQFLTATSRLSSAPLPRW